MRKPNLRAVNKDMGDRDYKLRRADFKLLEKVFMAEIEGRLPFQSKSKELPRLENDGLIVPMTRTFGADRFGPITASGWELTERGRFLYCQACAEIEG